MVPRKLIWNNQLRHLRVKLLDFKNKEILRNSRQKDEVSTKHENYTGNRLIKNNIQSKKTVKQNFQVTYGHTNQEFYTQSS